MDIRYYGLLLKGFCMKGMIDVIMRYLIRVISNIVFMRGVG